MRGRHGNVHWNNGLDREGTSLDLDALLHPSRAFRHPSDVVSDPDLTVNEKRAILASWASDACAVEAVPALRHTPDGTPVAFDDIMEALQRLDEEARDQFGRDLPPVRKRPAPPRRGSSDDGGYVPI